MCGQHHKKKNINGVGTIETFNLKYMSLKVSKSLLSAMKIWQIRVMKLHTSIDYTL